MTNGPPRCPSCGGHFGATRLGKTLVGGCLGCGGVWLDNRACQEVMTGRLSEAVTDLVRMLDEHVGAARPRHPYRGAAGPEGPSRVRTCVACGAPLLRSVVPVGDERFEIDVCPEDGAFFDRRELWVLVTAVALRDGALDLELAQQRLDAQEQATRQMFHRIATGRGIFGRRS